MCKETPWQYLVKQELRLDVRMKYVPSIILDNVSVDIGRTMCWLRTIKAC